eukprot:CAMPEP_0171158418 /NCGR_PEP_ID=MMETSP0790-20130122/2496_1 /TAXON_ID=2925 /ORGANISM="Alexandrium catenella, Strain OF101" /LENGTH=63 /DNA_ID=CAMNT_0011622849 /DNA_START=89 /DNA_END=277 /DNA_ORIENTATION=+
MHRSPSKRAWTQTEALLGRAVRGSAPFCPSIPASRAQCSAQSVFRCCGGVGRQATQDVQGTSS